FLAASVLHYEYVGSSTTVSALGYATAATVGFLRIARDKHWSSDVLVGAAIGMLVTNWTYLFIFGLIESCVIAILRKLKPRKQHSESE
ncbi:MAG: phosphatase PAP2 family protein, partial [Tannerellaceae bacterium]